MGAGTAFLLSIEARSTTLPEVMMRARCCTAKKTLRTLTARRRSKPASSTEASVSYAGAPVVEKMAAQWTKASTPPSSAASSSRTRGMAAVTARSRCRATAPSSVAQSSRATASPWR